MLRPGTAGDRQSAAIDHISTVKEKATGKKATCSNYSIRLGVTRRLLDSVLEEVKKPPLRVTQWKGVLPCLVIIKDPLGPC